MHSVQALLHRPISPSRALFGCSLTLVACGSAAVSPSTGVDAASERGADASDATTPDGAAVDVAVAEDAACTDSSLADASNEANTDSTTIDAGADSSVARADGATTCPADSAPKGSIASTGNVTFAITNTSSRARYVVTQSFGCDAFTLPGATLSLGFSCPCECSAPRPSFTVLLLAAGDTFTVVWDGRSASAYTTYQDCTQFGAPGRCGAVQNEVLQPVAPGALTVTFDYLTQAPQPTAGATCNATSQGFSCQATPGFSGQRCAQLALQGAQQANATFDLPASGGAVVPVSLP